MGKAIIQHIVETALWGLGEQELVAHKGTAIVLAKEEPVAA